MSFYIEITDSQGNWVDISQYVIPEWNSSTVSTSPFRQQQDPGRINFRVLDAGRNVNTLLREILLNRPYENFRHSVIRVWDTETSPDILLWEGVIEPAGIRIEGDVITSFWAAGLLSYGEKIPYDDTNAAVSLPADTVARMALQKLGCFNSQYLTYFPSVALGYQDWSWDYRKWLGMLDVGDYGGLGDMIPFLPVNPGNYATVGFVCFCGRVYRVKWNSDTQRCEFVEVTVNGNPISTRAVQVFWGFLPVGIGISCLFVVEGQYRGARTAVRVPWAGWNTIGTTGAVVSGVGTIGAALAQAGVITAAAANPVFASLAAAGAVVALGSSVAASATAQRQVISNTNSRLEYIGFKCVSIDDDENLGQAHYSSWNYAAGEENVKYLAACSVDRGGMVWFVEIDPERQEWQCFPVFYNGNDWVRGGFIVKRSLADCQPAGGVAVYRKQMGETYGLAICLGLIQGYALIVNRNSGASVKICRNDADGVPLPSPSPKIGVLPAYDDNTGWHYADFIVGNIDNSVVRVRVINADGTLPDTVVEGRYQIPNLGNIKIDQCGHPYTFTGLASLSGKAAIPVSILDTMSNGDVVRKVALLCSDPNDSTPVFLAQAFQFSLPFHGETLPPIYWKKSGEEVLEYASVILAQTDRNLITIDLYRTTDTLTPFVHHHFGVEPLSVSRVLREIAASFGGELRVFSRQKADTLEKAKLISRLVPWVETPVLSLTRANSKVQELSCVDWLEGAAVNVDGQTIYAGKVGIGRAVATLDGKWMTAAWGRVLTQWMTDNYPPPGNSRFPLGRRLLQLSCPYPLIPADPGIFLRRVNIDPDLVENAGLANSGTVISVGLSREMGTSLLTILEGSNTQTEVRIPVWAVSAPDPFGEIISIMPPAGETLPHISQQTIGWVLGGNWGGTETIMLNFAPPPSEFSQYIGYAMLVRVPYPGINPKSVCIFLREAKTSISLDTTVIVQAFMFQNYRTSSTEDGNPDRLLLLCDDSFVVPPGGIGLTNQIIRIPLFNRNITTGDYWILVTFLVDFNMIREEGTLTLTFDTLAAASYSRHARMIGGILSDVPLFPFLYSWQDYNFPTDVYTANPAAIFLEY